MSKRHKARRGQSPALPIPDPTSAEALTIDLPAERGETHPLDSVAFGLLRVHGSITPGELGILLRGSPAPTSAESRAYLTVATDLLGSLLGRGLVLRSKKGRLRLASA